MKITVEEFATSEGISKVEANAILKYLARKGVAQQTQNDTAGKRGRPASVFTMPDAGTLKMVA